MCSYGGHIYNKDVKLKDRTRWRCVDRKCIGVLILDKDSTVSCVSTHIHAPDIYKTNSIISSNTMYERAKTTNEHPIEIITKETSKMAPAEIRYLPKPKSVVCRMSKQRNKIIGYTKKDFDDIPDSLKVALNGDKFLQWDTGFYDLNRMIIFYTNESVKYLRESDVWLLDGTFKSCPTDFYQLYTIHSYVFGRSYQFIYCLMSNKTENSYLQFFSYIKDKINPNPKFMIFDFEIVPKIAAH